MNQGNVVVFAGLSISQEEVTLYLPEATVFSPARCGDVLQAIKLQPNVMVLIDGKFGNTPTVWHSEILFAMSLGIIVIGCSSMGALRAAELSQFGMIGSGKIYEAYLSGEIEGDDEVALVYDHQFNALNYALVDIRETFSFAVKSGKLTDQEAKALLAVFKELSYKKRTLPDFKASAEKKDLDESMIKITESILNTAFINLKHKESVETLKNINQLKIRANKTASYTFSNSQNFDALAFKIGTSAQTLYSKKFDRMQKLSYFSRILGKEYVLAKLLTKLAYCVLELDSSIISGLKEGVVETISYFNLVIGGVGSRKTLLSKAKQFMKESGFMRFSHTYFGFQESDRNFRMYDEEARDGIKDALNLFNMLWYIVYSSVLSQVDGVKSEAIEKLNKRFYPKEGFSQEGELKSWFAESNMPMDELRCFYEARFILEDVVVKHNDNIICVKAETKLGLYSKMLKLLEFDAIVEKILSKNASLQSFKDGLNKEWLEKERGYILDILDSVGFNAQLDQVLSVSKPDKSI
jgi:hypothetical protein